MFSGAMGLLGEDGAKFGEKVEIEAGLDFLFKVLATRGFFVGFPVVDVEVLILNVDEIKFGDGGGIIYFADEGKFGEDVSAGEFVAK